MKNKLNLTQISGRIVFCILSVMYLILFFLALLSYEGSKLYYLIFTMSFFLLLNSAFKKALGYSYLFLVVLLWLGFWLKFTIHTILNYPYNEPVGYFLSTAKSLDHVLLIATVGSWAVLFAHYFLRKIHLKSTLTCDSICVDFVPNFYKKNRNLVLILLVCIVIAIAIINFFGGVFQIGMVPRTILIWPGNAIFSWLLGIGFAMIFSTILWWDVQLKQRAGKIFFWGCSEPLFSSISIMSRGLYLFHFVPIYVAYLLNRTKLSIQKKKSFQYENRQLLMITFMSAVFLLISLQSVSWLRNYYYSGVSPNFIIAAVAEPPLNEPLEVLKSPCLVEILTRLVIDRWLGVEGVMAISAYPNKTMALLKKASMEKPDIASVDIYQKIANSHYQTSDRTHYLFATLPGAIAFFYYSGSLLIVFVGMFLLLVLMIFSEQLVAKFTKNSFLCALYGMDVANTVSQFGVTPSIILKHYILIFAYCLILYILQSKPLHHKIKSMPNSSMLEPG